MSEETDAGAARRDERERPLTDEERARLFHEQVKRLHTLDLVRATLADMVTLAYQKLGLTAETADLRDLGDVRVAIETVRRLVEVLDSEGAADEARTYRSTLAALQLQFAAAASAVQTDEAAPAVQSDEAASAAAPSDEAAPSAGKPPARKPSAKKPAAKKPAAKKPAAKKPAAKKPAARKPPAAGKPSSHTKKSAGKKTSGRGTAPGSRESQES